MILFPRCVRLFPSTKLSRNSRLACVQPRPAALPRPSRSAEPRGGAAAPWEAKGEASWEQLACGELPATAVRVGCQGKLPGQAAQLHTHLVCRCLLTTSQPCSWTRSLQLFPRSLQALVAKELQLSEAEAEARLQRLVQLLPTLAAQLARQRRWEKLARLAGTDASALAAAIVHLKAILPRTDMARLFLGFPELAVNCSAAGMA